jgi:hypothetical protein
LHVAAPDAVSNATPFGLAVPATADRKIITNIALASDDGGRLSLAARRDEHAYYQRARGRKNGSHFRFSLTSVPGSVRSRTTEEDMFVISRKLYEIAHN